MKIYHHLPEHKNLFRNPVVTIGNFDGVHLGHRKILSALLRASSRESGDPVVITFSTHPRKILNPEMQMGILTTTEEKVNAIYNFGIPNIILLNFTRQMAMMSASDFYHEILINRLDAKTLVIGYDHAFGKNREGNFDFLSELSSTTGVEIIRIDEEYLDSEPVSSTRIRRAIEGGDIRLANRLLGHRYSLSGSVAKGMGRGRSLGFPTANIIPASGDKIVPGDGVYAVTALTEDGTGRKGMLNIGSNPTFPDTPWSIEVHLFDYEGDLYDTLLSVEFHDRIRNEIRFGNKEQLVEQIKQDRESALSLMGTVNA